MAIKILVGDDNISLNAILRQVLVEEGFEVEAAADGQEGYLAYSIKRPDVILTDIHMPGKNVREFMKHIWMHNSEVRAMYMSGDWISFQSPLERKRNCP